MTTWTVQGFYGSQIQVEGGGSTLLPGSHFKLDPAWDYSTSRRTFVFTDDDANLSGDSNFLADEIGNDSNQHVTVYDASGTQIYSGQVYAEWSSTFTDPSGATVHMYTLEIGGTIIGEVATSALTPGVTYQVSATPDESTGPLFSSLTSMSFDPDLVNTILGGDYNDSIAAGAGNDTITTGAGADTIDGGSGDDSIQFGTGGDSVSGGTGNDYIDDWTGTTGYVWNDTLHGDAGNDTIWAGSGNDLVDGGDDNDSIEGEDGNDTLLGGNGIDSIYGGNGDDSVDGGAGIDIVTGDAGNDTIHGGDGADHLAGNAGNDLIYGDADGDHIYFEANWGSDTVFGGSTTTTGGVDLDVLDFTYLTGAGVSVTYTGWEDGTVTQGVNTITFDNIEGFQGSAQADTVNAAADGSGLWMDGAAGNDSLVGGSGNDTISGGTGDDTIYTGLGNDYATGGDGNDLIDDLAGVRAETYANYVDGGAGNDTVFTGGGADTILGGSGDDQLHGEAGNDSIDAGAGADTVDGGTGDDTIWAGGDNDSVWGDAGNDLIYGEGGNDTLLGAGGNDTLSGGSGSDQLLGGDDADTFLYYYGAGAGSIYGGEGGTDADIVQLYGAAAQVTWSGWEYGTITYAGDTATHHFWEIEQFTGTDHADTFNASAALSGVTIDAGAGNDTISGSALADSLTAGDGADTVQAGDGNDTISAGNGDDFIDAGAGNDSITAGAGNDSVWGGAGDDTIVAGAGANWIAGGDGADLITGSTDAGADTIDGGAGADTITAGAGNDRITGSSGDDRITTGLGHDTIIMADGAGHDFITDFDVSPNGNLTTDQLNVAGLHDGTNAPINVWDVSVTDDGLGNALLTFPDGTSVTLLGIAPATVQSPGMLHAMGVPCLVAGSRIATPRGPVPVEDLRPGDLVTVRDGPPVPVLWIGSRRVTGPELAADPKLRPVEIKAGRLGNAAPVRFSAQHGIAVPGGALARAGHLAATGWGGARVLNGLSRHPAGVLYLHLLLPRHALIRVEGLWVESFWPGPMGIAALDLAAKATLIRAIPALAGVVWAGAPVQKAYGPQVARFLRRCQIDRAACANWSRITCDLTHSDGFVTEAAALRTAFTGLGNRG